MSTARPSRSTTFAGLTSRWAMPRPCRGTSALSSWTPEQSHRGAAHPAPVEQVLEVRAVDVLLDHVRQLGVEVVAVEPREMRVQDAVERTRPREPASARARGGRPGAAAGA